MHRESAIDEFESMFRRAEREPYIYEQLGVNRVALITDGTTEEAANRMAGVRGFADPLTKAENWGIVSGADFSNIAEMLTKVEEIKPDLIVAHRHLNERSTLLRESLGAYVDVLTQTVDAPVLLLAGTKANPVSIDDRRCREVMVITDHIKGDNRLVNFGAAMAAPDGEVYLCHIEDDAVFERYMRVIEQIPGLDTETARTEISAQLTSDAQNFIDGCIEGLGQNVASIKAHSIVERGHRLHDYKRLVKSHEIDMIVINTKDEEQLAMHGMAYTLAVEMVDTALLLL
ncbi:MAG: hypothetical protein CMJ78_08010 [Planctomycetaceae bacterium]|nr:hypothetical protein [Planctomycetaceae bacterium]